MIDIKVPRILIVDDDEKTRKLMSVVLSRNSYNIELAKNGFEALAKTKEFLPDLIFLDILMPEVDGFETCQKLKEDPITKHIPVVMITSLSDRESKIKALKIGANDFITKPIDFTEVIARAQNLIKVKEHEDYLKLHEEMLEEEVRERTKLINDAFCKLKESSDILKKSYLEMTYRLTAVAEYKDEDTASHMKRIGHYCKLLAKNLGWSEEDQEVILFAGPLHDIGKVGIPLEILLKPKLTTYEFAIIKNHAIQGARILHGSISKYLQMAERIALTHHENWDGSGYPYSLKGEEIPLEGRIALIADQYDALRSRRTYRLPFGHEKVFKIITEGDGRTIPEHFDPQVLQIFKDNHKLFKEIFDEIQGQIIQEEILEISQRFSQEMKEI